MNNNKRFISLGRYFTHDEVQNIKGQLQAQDIRHLIKGHGPHLGNPTEFSVSEYFEVEVDSDKLQTAKVIADKVRVKRFVDNQKCPKCGHLGHVTVDKSMLERVLFIGTTLVQCKKCKKRFPV